MKLHIIRSEADLAFHALTEVHTLYTTLRSVYDALEAKFARTVGHLRYSLEKADGTPYAYEDMIEQTYEHFDVHFYFQKPTESETYFVIATLEAVYIEETHMTYFLVSNEHVTQVLGYHGN